MAELGAYGISVDLPRGWDGIIFRRPRGNEVSGVGASLDDGVVKPVAHLANFPLPADRGDYGSGAVERMGAGDVLVCVLEFDEASAGTALFSHEGVPRLRPTSFAPNAMQRTIPGMSGAQAFFHVRGRAFCVYSVLGSHRDRVALTPVVNELLASLRIGVAEASG